MSTYEVEVDGRKRLPLARLGGISEGDRFRVEVEADGSLHLVPLATISRRELELLRNPEAVAKFKRGFDEMKAGDVVDFSKELDNVSLDEDDEG